MNSATACARRSARASDTMKPNNPHLDQLFRILSTLDGHFRADDCSPADADRWRELKRHILRMLDGLGLAHIELETAPRPRRDRDLNRGADRPRHRQTGSDGPQPARDR